MLAAIDVWDSIRRTRLAGEPPLQTAATRRAVFPGVGAAAMLPASMRQLRVRVAQIAIRGLSFVQGPRSRDLVWGLTTVGSPPRGPPRTWLLLPDVITYRCTGLSALLSTTRIDGIRITTQYAVFATFHEPGRAACCLTPLSLTHSSPYSPRSSVSAWRRA
jgi:hypothetical protein